MDKTKYGPLPQTKTDARFRKLSEPGKISALPDKFLLSEGISRPSVNWSGSHSSLHTSQGSLNREKGVIVAPTGRITTCLALTAGVAAFGSSFPHGWNTGVLNSPMPIIQAFLNRSCTERFGYSPSQNAIYWLWALTNSIYLIGGCAGAFSAGWFANKFGRKSSLLLLHVLGFMSALLFGLCQYVNSMEMLILARLLVGYSCGAGSGLVPMYLTEVAPVNLRGAMGVIHQFALTCGILCSQISGIKQILGSDQLWPFLLAASAFPCIVSLIVLPFLPDSPRYLYVTKQDTEAATAALKRFRGKDDVKMDLEEMDMEKKQVQEEPSWSFGALISDKKLRLPLIIVCSLACAQQLSGINVVFYYSTMIFASSGIQPQHIQYAVLGTGLINVIMTAISVPLMEKSGRRPLLLGGMILMIIASTVITAALNLAGIIPQIAVGIASFVCVILFVVGFAIGLGSIPQFIGGELFKQGPRPPAMSLAGFLNWLCNFAVGMLFPSIQLGLKDYCFVPFIVSLILFLIFLWRTLPETKNKSFDEIYEMLGAKDDEKEEANGNLIKAVEMSEVPFDRQRSMSNPAPQSKIDIY